MSEPADMPEQPAAGWGLKLGVAIFVLSIILPVVGIAAVAALDLSPTITATVSGASLMGGEVLGLLAVVIMGKQGYLYIKSRIFRFLKRHGPPQEVSRGRYNIGLVMFCIPLLFAWVSVYAADYIPGFLENPLPYAIGGDLLLIVSLFVLGGDFWDKLKALFAYSDKVGSSQIANEE